MAAVSKPSFLPDDINHVLRADYDKLSMPILNDPMPVERRVVQFDPKLHLCYQPPVQRIAMAELGLESDPRAISDIGATLPFPLFTEEAIAIMKSEILQPEVFERYAMASSISKCQLRGYAKEMAPFTYAAWTHPSTMEIVSKEAGVELDVIFDYEIAHTNFNVKGSGSTNPVPNQPKDRANKGDAENLQSIVGWHNDSYPFVCVLMLSDTSKISGGETMFYNRKTNEAVRISDPKLGHATMLQGRCIEHIALKPKGTGERITMVTSYRPKDPLKIDSSVLSTVRHVSRASELYQEWADYRLNIVIERIQAHRKKLVADRAESDKSGRRDFDSESLEAFLKEQMAYLEQTYVQLHD